MNSNQDINTAPTWRGHERVAIRFGRKLNVIRTSRGVTQLQLAMRSERDRSFISDIERGVTEPTIRTLEKLALAFNMSISDLCEGV